MSTTIWEAVLKPLSEQRVRMPRGAKILSAQAQGNRPTIWFQCDPDLPLEEREICIVETGRAAPHPLNAIFKFIGTVQLDDGSAVVHIFASE